MMQDDICSRLASLVESIEHIEKESEEVYLALGRLFPRLAEEADLSVAHAELSLRNIQALSGLGTRVDAGVYARVEAGAKNKGSLAERSGDYFRLLHERDTDFLAHINESVQRLASLEDVIGRARSDSEEMEIISLNAMTVALKSGSQGKAFSVITDELKRLSTRTIELTREVTERGSRLLDAFEKLRLSLNEQGEYQKQFFYRLDEVLGKGYRGIESSLHKAVSFFGGLIERSRGLRDPVRSVMQEVQLQDIVRQSLQHVGISLREALTEASSTEAQKAASISGCGLPDGSEARSFIAAIAALSENLIDEIRGKLDESAASFQQQMRAVSSLVGESEALRLDFLSAAGSTVLRVDPESFTEGSARYLHMKRDTIRDAKRLAAQVKGLEDSFKSLAGILSRFLSIVVASRIEVAKTKALAGVSTTVQNMILLTGRIGEDVESAMSMTKSFIQSTSASISEYAASGDESRLTATLEKVKDDLARLDRAGVDVDGAIRDFSLYTPEFIALNGEAASLLDRLRFFSAQLEKARDSLSQLRRDLGPGQPSLGAFAYNARLKAIVNRFTIFAHKKAAGEIGSFDVEEGGGAGQITLF